MKHPIKAFFLMTFAAFVVAFSAVSAFAEDIRLEVQVNRDSMYIGESAVLTVRVSGSDDGRLQPDLSAITEATVRPLGSHSDSHFSMTIINGRMTRDSFTGRIYSYELRPLAAGQFRAGPVTLNANGKLLTATGPLIQVAGLEQQDSVILGVSSSRDAVLVGEQFEVTFSLALKRLAKPYDDADPLDPREPPDLSVPFLTDAPIDGIEKPSVQAFLNQHLTGRGNPGFHLNDYQTQPDLFNMNFNDPFGSRKAIFLFDRQSIDKDGNRYFQYTAKVNCTAQKEGSYTFGPAEFKGKIAIAADEQSRAVTKPFFAVGPACTVRVVPPPDEGRPASYVGALGTNMVLDATLDTQNCNVGDPLKLTVSIGGPIRLDDLWAPRLNLQQELGKHFRIIDDTVETANRNGSKTFIYSVRPTDPGTYEFPPIEVAYFDTVSRIYRTAKTAPIPIRVQATATVQSSNILYANTSNGEQRAYSELNPSAMIMAPLKVEASGAESRNMGISLWHMLFLAGGPLLFLFVLAGKYVRLASPRFAESERRRNAARQAQGVLKHVSKMDSKDKESGRRKIYEAMRNYIGDRTGIRTAGLTPSDARAEILRLTSDQALAEQAGHLLERSFNSAFANSATEPEAVAKDAEEAMLLIEQIEIRLKKTS